MRRQIFAYVPANVIPALVSVLMIYLYTRLLSVQAYGDYTLAFSVVMVAQATLFTPLSLGAVRFFPQAEKRSSVSSFLKTAYGALGLLGLAAVVLLPAVLLLPGPARSLLLIAGAAVLLLVLRGVVALNQSVNRMRDLHMRYNVVECGQALFGLAAGIAVVVVVNRPELDGALVLAGLALGSAICAAIDLPMLVSALRLGRFERRYAVDLATFGTPLAGTYLTSFMLQYADRFVVGALGGAGAVAVYAVAYSLVERPTTLLCTSISTATFPMAVRALENDGVPAARLQAGRNGAALLALAVPACVGLGFAASHIAAVLVGEEYRAGVAMLIPIMAVTAVMRGVSVHFVEHAFHLARRPDVLLRIYGPAAIANIGIGVVGVSMFGVIAAAWIALACQTCVLVTAWFTGRRYFPLWLPWQDVACLSAASAVMAVALLEARFPETPVGLGLLIATGGLAYGAAQLLLHGLRRVISGRRMFAMPLAGSRG